MAKCDVCGRPATTQLTVRDGGQTRQINLCDQHYAEAVGEGFGRSPLESLFGGSSLFDEFRSFFDEGAPFGGRGGAATGRGGADARRAGGRARPLASVERRQRSREAVDLRSFLNEAAMDRLQAAAEKALEFGKTEVDTEHLLMALVDNDVVQEILKEFKLSATDLKQSLAGERAARRAQAAEGETPQIGVSPRAKSALEHALVASRELEHSYVGPEHILIGLVEEEDGFAGELLRKLGLSRPGAAAEDGEGGRPGRRGGQAAKAQPDARRSTSTRATSRQLARQGKLDPVIGRAKEIETTIEVLARRKKNNPVLIGEPGVGKTAIVEGLAQRIVQDQVPEVLRNKRLVELNINSLVAGSKYRGEFEERVKSVLDEIIANQNEMIVFIDELHTIVGAGQGGGEGGLDIANTFKPALARGELHLIGATTLNEYQKYIEKDAALERRFQPVMVPEPSIEDTIEILRGLRDRFEAHHKVKITRRRDRRGGQAGGPLHHRALPAGQGDRPDRPGGGAGAHPGQLAAAGAARHRGEPAAAAPGAGRRRHRQAVRQGQAARRAHRGRGEEAGRGHREVEEGARHQLARSRPPNTWPRSSRRSPASRSTN